MDKQNEIATRANSVRQGGTSLAEMALSMPELGAVRLSKTESFNFAELRFICGQILSVDIELQEQDGGGDRAEFVLVMLGTNGPVRVWCKVHLARQVFSIVDWGKGRTVEWEDWKEQSKFTNPDRSAFLEFVRIRASQSLVSTGLAIHLKGQIPLEGDRKMNTYDVQSIPFETFEKFGVDQVALFLRPGADLLSPLPHDIEHGGFDSDL